MKYFSQKNIRLVVLFSGILLLGLALFFIITRKEDEPAPYVDTTSRYDETKRAFIDDFHQLQDPIIQPIQKRIENRLYDHASDNGNEPGLYTAIIKEDSYAKQVRNGVSVISFLVDTRPTNITYKVTVRNFQGNSSVIISCAPADQQTDQQAICEDAEYI